MLDIKPSKSGGAMGVSVSNIDPEDTWETEEEAVNLIREAYDGAGQNGYEIAIASDFNYYESYDPVTVLLHNDVLYTLPKNRVDQLIRAGLTGIAGSLLKGIPRLLSIYRPLFHYSNALFESRRDNYYHAVFLYEGQYCLYGKSAEIRWTPDGYALGEGMLLLRTRSVEKVIENLKMKNIIWNGEDQR